MHTRKQRKQTLKDVLSAYLMPFPAANTKVRPGRCKTDSLSTDLWFLPYKGLNTLGLRLSVYVYTCHVCVQGGPRRQVKLSRGSFFAQLLNLGYHAQIISLDGFAAVWEELRANLTLTCYASEFYKKNNNSVLVVSASITPYERWDFEKRINSFQHTENPRGGFPHDVTANDSKRN